MTVIRDIGNTDVNVTNYVASLALICGLATTVLMLKFRGFKASLTFGLNKKRGNFEHYSIGTENISVKGAYRTNREEFFGYGSLSDPPKKIDPSMVILPPNQATLEYQNPLDLQPKLKPSKSTNDLNEPGVNTPAHLMKSTPNVSTDPRGGTSSNRDSIEQNKTNTEKQEKLLEKKENKITKLFKSNKASKSEDTKNKVATDTANKNTVADTSGVTGQNPADNNKKKLAPQPQDIKEQKRIEKELKKQQAIEDKVRKEQLKAEKKKKKSKAPQQPTQPPAIPVPVQRSNPLGQSTGYPTNTLESSISRSSGPPPYSNVPDKLEVIPNERDDTGNTSFGKKIDETSSWDMVSAHRNQMRGESRPLVTEGRPKRMVMDLKYNVEGPSNEIENSDA